MSSAVRPHIQKNRARRSVCICLTCSSPRPSPVPPGGSPSPTLLLLLPTLPLLPQLQSVRTPPLLPCRLLPPGRRQGKRDLCQVKGRSRGLLSMEQTCELGGWNTCCSTSSPHLLLRGLIQKAAAPEERPAETEEGWSPSLQ